MELARVELRYRRPYDWQRVLQFLAGRAIPGVESVEIDARNWSWQRSVRWSSTEGEVIGAITMRPIPRTTRLQLTLPAALAADAAAIAARVQRIFDLDRRPSELATIFGPGPEIAGVRIVGAFDGFEMAVRAVLGQQVSVARARTLAQRVVERFGDDLPQAVVPQSIPAGLRPTKLFPRAQTLAAGPVDAMVDALASLGMVGVRARGIVALARACADGSLTLVPGAPPQETIERLCELPGIGDWTAHYIAMRALCWTDAFPAADLMLMRALGVRTAQQARRVAQAWRPMRAYAVFGLWTGAIATPEQQDSGP